MQWQHVKGQVVANKPLNQEIWQLTVSCPEIALTCRPGNFVMLRSWEGDLYLPRPMAIFEHSQNTVTVCYRVKGKGTQLLTQLGVTAEIEITGPLGLPVEHNFQGKTAVFIGRGVGVTPLLAVAQAAKRQGGQVFSLISARRRELVIGEAQLAELGSVQVQCDDETDELITMKLLQLLGAGGKVDQVYVSGSKRLFRHCQSLSESYSFKVYVFLESHMACGVGHCKGCAVELKQGPKKYGLCCKDGPLFSGEQVVME